MIVHIYRFGDKVGMDIQTPRVTMLESGYEKFNVLGKVLVLGTGTVRNRDLTNIDFSRLTVIPMETIEWFWVEEN